MPFIVSWDNDEKTVLRCDVHGHWTWDEFHRSLDQEQVMLQTVTHPVALLNVRHDNYMPKGNPLPHYRRAARELAPNQVITVSVSSDAAMTQVIMKMMTSLFPFIPKKFAMVSTVEEAYALIDEKLGVLQ